MNKLFLSCVSKEFGAYRELLTQYLRRAKVELRVQEDFSVSGTTLLDALDAYIRECDAVVHLIGDGSGAFPEVLPVRSLLERYPDMAAKIPLLADALSQSAAGISYTQWEAYLAIYHGCKTHIYLPSQKAPRGAGFSASDEDRRSQERHLERIRQIGWHRGTFDDEAQLTAQVLADLRSILGSDGEPFSAAPTKLPKTHDSGVFEGREKVLADLDALWADVLAEKAGRARIVSLIAIGGAGKTTVASRWKDALLARQDHGGVERYFDWSFFRRTGGEGGAAGAQTAADATFFVAAALKFFGDPAMAESAAPAWDKGARLAALVAEHRTLLILDGLEPLQYPPGPQTGELKDDAIRALFAGLQNAPGLCVVTTRQPVADLGATRETTTPEWRLDHLSDAAGALILKRYGVTGPEDELRRASREVKGHALTLTLVGHYLALAFDPPDIARRDCFRFAEVNAEVQNGHAFNVFDEYVRWFESEDRRVELAILQLLGLFDGPATPDCLAALCEPPAIPGLTEPLVDLGERQWNAAIQRLRGLGLIETSDWVPLKVSGYGKDDALAVWDGIVVALGPPQAFQMHQSSFVLHTSIDAHPLLREYFEARLIQNGTAPAGHARLYELLRSSVPYWPEGRDGLVPLYQAVAHGCKAGLFEETRAQVYTQRIMRGSIGPYAGYGNEALGLFGLGLAAVASFFAEPWRRLADRLEPTTQSWLRNEAGFFLRALNRLVEARELMRVGSESDVEREDWLNAAISTGNLSELELVIGDVQAGESTAARSVALADRGGNSFQMMGNRATHADALHQAGQFEASRILFAEAEAMQSDRQPDYPLLYSVQGYRYCDLLLGAFDRAAWQGPDAASLVSAEAELTAIAERAARTLVWARSNHVPLLDLALHQLTLGRVYLLATLVDELNPLHENLLVPETRELLNAALAALRESSSSHDLPRALLPSACLHVLLGEWDLARQRLDESFSLATRGANPKKNWEGGMRLHLIDTLLHRARLFAKQPEYPWPGRTPRMDLEEAAKLIEVCGYHRRDGELADAMAAIPA